MQWHKHYKIPQGTHAPFSASKYSWLNYTDEKAVQFYMGILATRRGTELHEHAANCIKFKTKLKGRNTLASYVNDAIGFRMRPEQLLYYSDLFFGTCDAISHRNGTLRIHDLKTGATPAKFEQLIVYDALYCLEYEQDPAAFKHELRIYQNDEVMVTNPEASDIIPVMNHIVHLDRILSDYISETNQEEE